MIDPNTASLLTIALLNAGTAFFAWRTSRLANETKDIAKRTEIHTNGMKDTLVAAVARSAKIEGKQEGKEIGKQEGRIEVLTQLTSNAQTNK